MHILIILVFLFILTGCETTIKIETPVLDSSGNAQLTAKGKPIYVTQKLSETAFLAVQNTKALEHLKDVKPDTCIGMLEHANTFTTAEGEGRFAEAIGECFEAKKFAYALNRPISPQARISAENSKAMVAVEQGQADKVRQGFKFGIWSAGAYALTGIASDAFSAAGSNYTVGDVQMSNSGTSSSGGGEEGAGGDGQSGDRNMGLAIGGDVHTQSGVSNTQASGRDKPTAVDNPIISGGPENSVVNDSDGNGNDGQLF